MRPFPFFGFAALLAAFLVMGTGCKDETILKSRCADDSQCIAEHDGNPNWACDRQIGDCVCTGDAACGSEREHCELRPAGDGRCHPNVTCEWNPDCPPNSFCDIDSRFCRNTGCSDDLQCNLGQICDPVTRTCVDGCRSHGDCNLRDVCLCTDDEGNPAPCVCDEANRAGCQVGSCTPNTCADKTFCRYGELCVPGPAGELPTCVVDDRGNYCGNCTFQPGGVRNNCGSDGPDFCLLDSTDPAGRASFCGVDCNQGQECPNGFSCHDVLVLTEATCRSDDVCVPRPDAPTCTEDEECRGGRCVNGRCAGRCAVGEGNQQGFCSCVQDSDCPQQACGSDGRCEITREQCTPGSNDTCRGAIRCVQDGTDGIGYCMIGRNCAPDQGVTCNLVRCDLDPSACE